MMTTWFDHLIPQIPFRSAVQAFNKMAKHIAFAILFTLLLSRCTCALAQWQGLQPLPLSNVRFRTNSDWRRAAQMDYDFVASLSSEDLAIVFTRQTNITMPDDVKGFTGGWEDQLRGNGTAINPGPDHPRLYSGKYIAGQFTGHWLSAAARFQNATGAEHCNLYAKCL